MLVLVFGVVLDSGASRPHRRTEPLAAGAAGERPSPESSHVRPSALTSRSESEAIAPTLRHTSYVRLGRARRRDVALTFDDGPSPFTGQILRILRKTHTPATFFVIGRSVQLYPRLVADEAHDGFAVGDHTETHAFLSLLSPDAQALEISRGASAIRAAGALWSADTSDYARPGVHKIIYTAVSGAQPGAIILMHDGGGDRSQTVAALPRIIQRLRERHFRLVTVSQLVADDPPPFDQPPPQPLSGRG